MQCGKPAVETCSAAMNPQDAAHSQSSRTTSHSGWSGGDADIVAGALAAGGRGSETPTAQGWFPPEPWTPPGFPLCKTPSSDGVPSQRFYWHQSLGGPLTAWSLPQLMVLADEARASCRVDRVMWKVSAPITSALADADQDSEEGQDMKDLGCRDADGKKWACFAVLRKGNHYLTPSPVILNVAPSGEELVGFRNTPDGIFFQTFPDGSDCDNESAHAFLSQHHADLPTPLRGVSVLFVAPLGERKKLQLAMPMHRRPEVHWDVPTAPSGHQETKPIDSGGGAAEGEASVGGGGRSGNVADGAAHGSRDVDGPDAGPPEVGVPSPVAAADVTTVPAPAANGLHAPFACPSCREAFMKESACFKHVRSDFDCKGAYGTLEQSELRRLCLSGR